MANQKSQPEQINIFRLVDPQDWFDQRDRILKTLVSAINPSLPGFVTPKYSFSVDPVCGWIRFTLENDLWLDHPKRSLPQNADAATKAAKEFIARLQSACQQKQYLELNIPPLLPVEGLARIVPVGTTPVFHFNKPWIDHWLCRFEVSLRPFEDDRTWVRVFGSGIDIRLGRRSKVSSFVSHWRPAWIEKAERVQMFHLKEEGQSHSDEDHEPPTLVYELDGENCPQTFITPYYLSLEGDDGGMFPASDHSLLVAMGFAEKEQGGAYVVPNILGGSGDYTINWAYWRPDVLFEEGLVALGENEFIELLPGAYNLMLHVKDKKTGVVQLYESMAFVKGELQIVDGGQRITLGSAIS